MNILALIGRQRKSQALRERFLAFSGWKPHQKFLKIKFRVETVWEKKRAHGIGGKGCCN
jgi:hypothetical protein